MNVFVDILLISASVFAISLAWGQIWAIVTEIRTERFWARKMERVLDPAELMGETVKESK